MKKNSYLFTSESVTEGHPDKICDQISDAVLDAILEKDPDAHVACETVVTTGMALIMGEISTSCYVDIQKLARQVIREIGYTNGRYGYDGSTCTVLTCIDEQSEDIAAGVNQALEGRDQGEGTTGAGDQGMMFGYACDETAELMPLPISLSHRLAKRLATVRKDGTLPYLGPDGKTQVTIRYEDGIPQYVDTIVISSQHDENIALEKLEKDLILEVIKKVIPAELLKEETKFFINPTGRFVTGGPQGDSGLTGRKIIVDTYGGYSRHGGGAFSGKDPTKVDRSGAYAARYIAKNIVAAGLAKQCEVQLAYAIGVAHPVSIMVDTFGTGIQPDNELSKAVEKTFDLTPDGIIKSLDLRRPIYRQVAAYGHMGREDLGVPWEKTDQVDALKKYFSK